ncbi:hypothetical protein MRB53_037926 [Persea americana]|nr:hypothetical protein MRB53_037926 [Persea americana]
MHSKTQEPMMPPKPSLTLIVAATPTLGIGLRNALPWPQLKHEMAYFARVTKRLPPSTSAQNQIATTAQKTNTVIMGRKTWESIPPRFRPLKGRANVVVSRTLKGDEEVVKGARVARSLDAAVRGAVTAWLEEDGGEGGNDVKRGREQAKEQGGLESGVQGRIFVIGGAALYSAAMALPPSQVDLRVLLTKEQATESVQEKDHGVAQHNPSSAPTLAKTFRLASSKRWSRSATKTRGRKSRGQSRTSSACTCASDAWLVGNEKGKNIRSGTRMGSCERSADCGVSMRFEAAGPAQGWTLPRARRGDMSHEDEGAELSGSMKLDKAEDDAR